MIKCPRCSKEVSERPGTVCPRCGYKVSEALEKIRCPEGSCKAMVSKKLEYCPRCGCKLKGYKLSELIKMAKHRIDETFSERE